MDLGTCLTGLVLDCSEFSYWGLEESWSIWEWLLGPTTPAGRVFPSLSGGKPFRDVDGAACCAVESEGCDVFLPWKCSFIKMQAGWDCPVASFVCLSPFTFFLSVLKWAPFWGIGQFRHMFYAQPTRFVAQWPSVMTGLGSLLSGRLGSICRRQACILVGGAHVITQYGNPRELECRTPWF